MKLRALLLSLLFLAVFAALIGACDDDDCNCPDFQNHDDDTEQTDDDATDDDATDDELNISQWYWFPVPGSQCRDGSPTGIGARFVKGSDKLAIYVKATGVCVFSWQCDVRPPYFDETIFDDHKKEFLISGLFNADIEENPLRDWNMVFIPGCTGDMHAGNNPNGRMVDTPERQWFVGFENLKLMVPAIKELFEDRLLSRILVWGSCSGGNGALVAYPLVADAFPDIPVTLLDDSGLLVADDQALSPCFQNYMRYQFDMTPSFPAECTDCSLPNGDGLAAIQPYLAKTYPQGNFGGMSFLQDVAIRLVWGLGQDHCFRFLTADSPLEYFLTGEQYSRALFDLRDNYLLPTGRWSTLYVNGLYHTFGLESNDIWENDDAAFIIRWIDQLVGGGVPLPVVY